MEKVFEGAVVSGSASIHYQIYGQGEPLVLLHGNGESSSYFKHQLQTLGSRFRLIAIDTRAHGKSTRGSDPMNFYQLADDVAAVLDALQIQKASILGFSDGGNIALHFALRHPRRIKSLVLNGANLSPGGIKLFYQLPIALGWALCALCALFFSAARTRLDILGLMVRHPHLRPGFLWSIRVPVLVIAGEHDMVRRPHTELIAASLPYARLKIVPKATHFVASETPDVFNAAVLSFFNEAFPDEAQTCETVLAAEEDVPCPPPMICAEI